MDKTYNPFEIEQKWYQEWESKHYFAPRPSDNNYCIMIPPPNVTGSLHMGHGFQQTLMDALTRYHRMLGLQTLWQVGTDHAGISTQMVVERELAKQQQSRHDLGRDGFVERVWQWREESGNTITQQMRRLGVSVDWQRERFTMDEDLSDAVKEVFIRLYDEGLIYRGNRLVNWDPHFQTAISDVEVINQEEDGFLWHIRYPIADSDESLVIATTRPETLLGDSAVAVHPEDERYQHLVGKFIQLPLCDRTIPIIQDEYVDKEFGTGCVKITPAHDFNDYEVGMRHNLPQINIFTTDAKINEQAPKAYHGLDRFEAREQIIKDLTAQKLLVKTEPHKLSIPRADRGNTVVEPYLTNQWFVKMDSLAEPAIDVVKQGKVKFVPENWSKTYFQWLENIQDWCISRQLWWGHRIPAWYDKDNNIYVGQDEADVRQKYSLSNELVLEQDHDVLDTWFSSALWPFATLGWPKQTPELKHYYPSNVLVTGFDIIFFWVARMIMMGLKFMDDVPFHEVYITGLIRDSEGKKMSKTKGNVLDPIDLIDGVDLDTLLAKRTKGLMLSSALEKIKKQTRKEFPEGIASSGTDALRFTFCALASTGRDIRFDLSRLEGYRNFCNKLWNAARFVLMNLEGHVIDKQSIELSVADQWIQSRLQQTIKKVHHYFSQYRFDLLAQTLYEFTWNEYCDWYLELVKPVLYSKDNAMQNRQNGARYMLAHVLDSLLRLMHPIMPFITEEIWQQVKGYIGEDAPTLMLEAYPKADETLIDEAIETEMTWVQQFIIGLRTLRAEMNIAPSKSLPVILAKGDAHAHQLAKKHQTLLTALARLDSIESLAQDQSPGACATTLVGDLEILVPMAGFIDKDAELKRLHKELEKLEKEISRSESKLANPGYTSKAPEQVVAKERENLSESQAAFAKLQEKKTQIEAL